MVAPGGHRRGGTQHPRVNAAAQPLLVVTNWGAHGALPLAILLLAIAAAGMAYAYALARASALSVPAVAGIAAAALAAAWCSPLLFSSDVYAYAAYGELARLGLSPYAHAPANMHDALLRDAAWQWSSSTFPICVYGPAFVALARAVVEALAPLGTLAQLDGLRLAASAALLLIAPLAYAAYGGDRAGKMLAATTIVLNPPAIWCAAEGHNDAIALAVVLAGFAVARRGFFGVGAAIVAFSGLIKSPAAVAAVALAALHRRALFGAAMGIALVVLFSIPLILGIGTRLAPHGQYAPQASLQAAAAIFGPIAALAAAGALCVALMVAGYVRLRRGDNEGWLWLGIGAWVLVPNPYPWYGIWLIALAALAPRTRIATAAILLSFSSLLRYVPDAVGQPAAGASVALGVAASLPLLLLLPRGWYNGRPR
ncbi:MAG: hypothetical protein JO190_12415 [Candidatus Eremiobacteraeota bacterium]|nr:hypothetical protein [Candidatus Eremiobacteraeota bacterium]MBV8498161.1 hypothetical protein [Candidatus Eremiobacteraeota bacterium]